MHKIPLENIASIRKNTKILYCYVIGSNEIWCKIRHQHPLATLSGCSSTMYKRPHMLNKNNWIVTNYPVLSGFEFSNKEKGISSFDKGDIQTNHGTQQTM